MQIVAICPHDSAPHPTGYYLFEAETLEDAKRKGRQCCTPGQYVSSLYTVKKMGGKSAADELLWDEGERYHCIVDDICKLINEAFGIKTQVTGKESRTLFCPNKKDYFAKIEVIEGERVDVSMALYDNGQTFLLADPDCFDKILDYIDWHRRSYEPNP